MKFCKDCDSWKNTEDFNLNKRRSDGLSFYCRDCSRRRANKYYSDNPEPAKERAKAHRLADPERKKQNGAQWRAANKEYIKEYGKVWYSENKDKASESSKINYLKNKESRDAKNKDWALSNPEARREHKKRWKAKNKERVRLDSLRRRARLSEAPTVPFTETELAQKFAYWGNACWICRGPVEAADHVKPVSKGGPHMLANLRPACKPCNSSKGGKWPFPTLRPSGRDAKTGKSQWHIQASTLDNGSAWVRNKMGEDGDPALTVFVIDDEGFDVRSFALL